MTPGQNKQFRLLIVDDEELLAKSCLQILTTEGYHATAETRGRGALDVIRRQRPEIVLADLMLPDIDGLDLLREIRQLSPKTLVIMITGFATVNSSVEAMGASAGLSAMTG